MLPLLKLKLIAEIKSHIQPEATKQTQKIYDGCVEKAKSRINEVAEVALKSHAQDISREENQKEQDKTEKTSDKLTEGDYDKINDLKQKLIMENNNINKFRIVAVGA